jgi:hypothetical protein
MTLRKPSLFLRAIILGAQGVFYNIFCVSPCDSMRFLLIDCRSLLLYGCPSNQSSIRRLSGGGGRSDIVIAISRTTSSSLDKANLCHSTRCIEEIEAGRLPGW